MSMLPLLLSLLLLGPSVPSPMPAHVYWEDLTPHQKMTVLRAASLNRDALGYHRGRLAPTDDDRTFALLDGMTSPWPVMLPSSLS